MDVESGNIPAAVFETGHFGAVPHRDTRLTTFNHECRSRARKLARDNNPYSCWLEGFDCVERSDTRICREIGKLAASDRQRHFEQQLRAQFSPFAPGTSGFERRPKRYMRVCPRGYTEPRRAERRQHTANKFYPNEHGTEAALARSDVPLSGEHRHRRCPSLERQEAFYDQSTSGGKVRVRRPLESEDAQVAELYQNGLLYNSEEATQTFDLNSIRHDEPTYIIRPAKRARKNKAKQQTYSLENPLHLDLSFSDIADDEALAQYFFASQQASPEVLQHASQESGDSSPPPLRVIYELAGSQGSVDVDASQPPDLVLDEFELVSDSDMSDSPDPSAWVMVGDDL